MSGNLDLKCNILDLDKSSLVRHKIRDCESGFGGPFVRDGVQVLSVSGREFRTNIMAQNRITCVRIDKDLLVGLPTLCIDLGNLNPYENAPQGLERRFFRIDEGG